VTPRAALTIAGSDSGGGAGIQADLKTFAAHGVFPTTAITAVTAQNTREVTDVLALDPELVAAQIRAVVSDLPISAAKTGMLARAETVATVGAMAAAGELPPLVVDPVLVTSSGHSLLDEGGVRAYRDHLLPHALVATPNLREAAVLTGRDVRQLRDEEAMAEAGTELHELGARFVVVKGGHLEAPSCPDVIVGPEGTSVLPARRVATGNDHGTGCSLSAAVAANLTLGLGVLESISEAKAYVHRAIVGAMHWRLGAGHGPIDHFGWDAADGQG
jgi:hydroxymethylpyrimidine/phosphomethylpyrimidine kinase